MPESMDPDMRRKLRNVLIAVIIIIILIIIAVAVTQTDDAAPSSTPGAGDTGSPEDNQNKIKAASASSSTSSASSPSSGASSANASASTGSPTNVNTSSGDASAVAATVMNNSTTTLDIASQTTATANLVDAAKTLADAKAAADATAKAAADAAAKAAADSAAKAAADAAARADAAAQKALADAAAAEKAAADKLAATSAVVVKSATQQAVDLIKPKMDVAVALAKDARAASNAEYEALAKAKADAAALAKTSATVDMTLVNALAKSADGLRIKAEGLEETARVLVDAYDYAVREVTDYPIRSVVMASEAKFFERASTYVYEFKGPTLISPNQNYVSKTIGTIPKTGFVLFGVALAQVSDQGGGSSDGGAWHVGIVRDGKAVYDYGFMVSNWKHVTQYLQRAIRYDGSRDFITSPSPISSFLGEVPSSPSTLATYEKTGKSDPPVSLIHVKQGDQVTITAAGWYPGHVTKIGALRFEVTISDYPDAL